MDEGETYLRNFSADGMIAVACARISVRRSVERAGTA
jgi:hypothetical protein